MSGGTTAVMWAGVAMAAVSAGVSYMGAQKQAGEQKAALAESEKNAQATATSAERANNAANAQGPNTAAIEAKNAVGVTAGDGGNTMLTSPSGVDPAKLQLGKNTLLGS